MSTTIQRLARWARDLQLDDAPSPVVERLRLQQLGLAGAARAVADWPAPRALASSGTGRGAGLTVTGGSSSRRDAARLHGALCSWLDHDDRVLYARAGSAAAPAAWAHARGHSLGELLTAVLAGQEIAGRLGASLLLGPHQGGAEPLLAAVAAATTAGLLEGLSAEQLAHALALASLAAPQRSRLELASAGAAAALTRGRAVVVGLDAVAQAAAGLRAPLGAWDDRNGVVAELSPAPLRAAFTGLGRAWITSTLAYHLHPGAAWLQCPVQAVHEILRRHVKAADKRLRWDQVRKIEIELSAPAWWASHEHAVQAGAGPQGLVARLPELVGLLVVHHDLDPARFHPDDGAGRWESVAHVAGRVELRHSWSRTMSLAEHLVDVVAPLLAGLTPAELDAARAARQARVGARLPRDAADALLLVRARTLRGHLLERLRYSTGDLADARLDELQHRLGADVRLHTTRGGSWPEHRDLAEGSPGWPWDQTRAALITKWGEPGLAETLLAADPAEPAEDWVRALLQPG